MNILLQNVSPMINTKSQWDICRIHDAAVDEKG